MKIRKLFLAAGVLIVPVLLHPFTSAPAEEMWLICSDYNQDGNPILISQLKQGAWQTEPFPPSDTFEANYAPSPGIDPDGNLWMVWAAITGEEAPAVYFSRRISGVWSSPRRVDGTAERWESTPTIAFDQGGNPVVAFAGADGESTEIFCAGWNGDGFNPAVMVSSPDGSPDSRPSLATGENGSPIVVWEGWSDGHARIFMSRLEVGGWSPEEIIDPRPGIDQILPCAQPGMITWLEDGSPVALPEGERGTADPVAVPGLPDPGPDAWILVKRAGGEVATRRYRTQPPEARASAPPGRSATLATYYYIGYGDRITSPRSQGPDIGNWYGTHLAAMLPTRFPGHSFVLYNEAYPLSVTEDLLNGAGSCPGIDAVIDSRPLATKILIMGGTNDVAWGVALSDTAYYLGQMIDRARAKGVEPILATIIPRVDAIGNFSRSTDLSNNYIPQVASSKNCTLADPFQVFMSYYPTDYFWEDLYGYPYYWDGIEPNGAEGNQEIADAWYAAFSNPTPTPTPAGLVLDSGDYDGDSTSDIAVFRQSSGRWAIKGVTRTYFGADGVPASGDFDGDGTTDLAVFRSGLWAVKGITRTYFGGSADIPVPGDYDGDGTCDAGIYRGAGGLWAVKGVTRSYFGGSGALPVPVYGGAGESAKHIGIFRPSAGLWAIKGVTRVYFGGSSDQPVPANYSDTPDSLDLGIFRPSAGLWAVRGVTRVYFGSSNDRPVVGNYTGFIPADAGIFRPSSGLWAVRGVTRAYFGSSADIPVSGLAINPSSAFVP